MMEYVSKYRDNEFLSIRYSLFIGIIIIEGQMVM